ncbi:unnamed protein product [Sphagnum troendelagicum]
MNDSTDEILVRPIGGGSRRVILENRRRNKQQGTYGNAPDESQREFSLLCKYLQQAQVSLNPMPAAADPQIPATTAAASTSTVRRAATTTSDFK